jgi:hypothetical protein
MTWFKVDDSFHAHPKILATEPAALGLWVIAGAWSSAHLTDGVVPDHALSRLLPDSAELAQKLVTTGLWRRIKGGYRFHDWAHYQPSKADVEEERNAARERMRKLRQGRKVAAQTTNGSREHKANVRENFGERSEEVLNPDPTRPVVTTKPSSSTATPSTDKDFDRFWEAYPRRIGKGQARKAWNTAAKKTDPEIIIEAAGRFTASRGNQDPKFTPHPSTWLNGERWGDAPEPEPAREPTPVMPWDLWS